MRLRDDRGCVIAIGLSVALLAICALLLIAALMGHL